MHEPGPSRRRHRSKSTAAFAGASAVAPAALLDELAARLRTISEKPLSTGGWALAAFAAVVIAILYFLAARLSLGLLEKADGVAVFWPAAGVASGTLIALGPAARWPVVVGVMAATLGANLLGDRNLPSSIIFAIANAGEAALIASIIHRLYGPRFELSDLRRVLGLFAATSLATLVSGIVGTFGFVLFHAPAAPVPTIWLHWFIADALGTITVAPLAIGLASLLRDAPARREFAEGTLAIAVVGLLSGLIVFLPNEPWTLALGIASLCPLLVWISARFPPAFSAVATFICAITIVWTTTYAVGIFGDPRLTVEQRILSAQATILAISFGGLVLAGLFSERRLYEAGILERERRLEEALQAGGVIAFDWDVRADKVRQSQTATQMLGSRQALGSAEWLAPVHPDDRPAVTACIAAIRPDAPSYSVKFRYLRPDGNGEAWLEQVAIAEFDAAGQPVRVHGLTTDISERLRSEQQISRAQRAAELANRAKSSFLAAASHDLRQPLQTLRFLQGSLATHHADGDGRKVLDDMDRSLNTMSNILSALLDVNQLESGHLRPSKSDFALNDVFRSVASDVVPLVEEKGLLWRLVGSDLVVRSDKRMVEEMIRNLLSNSVRYTDRGRILLGCRRSRNAVRIEVWDSGVGIARDQLPHIFEEYYQGPDSAERGGFGLGLAIVKRLGEILGHQVEVRSTPGKGTRFSIELPLGQPGLVTQGATRSAHHVGSRLPRSILVIEDEASVRHALRRLLNARGIDPIVVASADDALALVGEHALRPDLVLCDYNLRGSPNGIESIKALRAALACDVPAIAMTGDTRSKTIDAIASNGVSVLVKPFSADELLQLIGRVHCGSEAPEPLELPA